ncbi:MAG TPA: MFS transporter, partial [Longimicrobiales bacterium]|nr:MFS transporter [Longimicrobiales bacterium]
MIPALLLTPLFYLNLPSGRRERTAKLPQRPGEVLRHLVGPLGLLFGVSAILAWAQRAFLTMVPIIVNQAGGSETQGALALTAYLGAQTMGTLTGGYLADRVDRRRLLVGICALAAPAHVVAVALPAGSALALLASALAGFLGMAALPTIVVKAQELLPHAAAVSSGIAMGLAWAAGSVGVLGTGALADRVGPVPATLVTMPMILVAMGLALHPSLRSTPVSGGA